MLKNKLRAMAIFTVAAHLIAFTIIIGGFVADLRNAELKETEEGGVYVPTFSAQYGRNSTPGSGFYRLGNNIRMHTVM